VVLHRRLADPEPLGHLGIREPFGDEAEHLELAPREPGSGASLAVRVARGPGEEIDRVIHRLPDRDQQVDRMHSLEDVGVYAGAEAPLREFGIVVAPDHQRGEPLDRRGHVQQFADDGGVHRSWFETEDEEIRLSREESLLRLLRARGGLDDIDPGPLGEPLDGLEPQGVLVQDKGRRMSPPVCFGPVLLDHCDSRV
jgi:hypothetical protein